MIIIVLWWWLVCGLFGRGSWSAQLTASFCYRRNDVRATKLDCKHFVSCNIFNLCCRRLWYGCRPSVCPYVTDVLRLTSSLRLREKLFARIISFVLRLFAYTIWGMQCKGNIFKNLGWMLRVTWVLLKSIVDSVPKNENHFTADIAVIFAR